MNLRKILLIGSFVLSASLIGCRTKPDSDFEIGNSAIDEHIDNENANNADNTNSDNKDNVNVSDADNSNASDSDDNGNANEDTNDLNEVNDADLGEDLFKDLIDSSFAVKSDDLNGIVWNSVITNTENGKNVSPELSWEETEGATCYAVYMVDTSVANWIHWKSCGITDNELPQGWASGSEYIGPYPPSGTHTYEIYVFALISEPERAKGVFNSSNMNFVDNVMALDIAKDGTAGNIISYGRIVGTYTKGE